MDLLVNSPPLEANGGDGWIDRAAFGWLPESYLRMMPRHAHITPVIEHDRGAPLTRPQGTARTHRAPLLGALLTLRAHRVWHAGAPVSSGGRNSPIKPQLPPRAE